LTASTTKYVAPAIPACLVVFFIIQKFYLRTSRQMRLMEIEAKAPLFTKFLEALSGLATIRAFGWETEFEEKFSKALNTSQKPYYYLWCIQRWLNLVLQLTVAALAILLTFVTVLTKGKVKAGLIGVSLVNVVGFSNTVKSLMTNWTVLETSIGALQRVKDFVESTESEHRDEERSEPPQEWPQHGRIEFTNLSASYG
jgi:ATP-binding cassette, subfamily C (CFTR/MRP), member 1